MSIDLTYLLVVALLPRRFVRKSMDIDSPSELVDSLAVILIRIMESANHSCKASAHG